MQLFHVLIHKHPLSGNEPPRFDNKRIMSRLFYFFSTI